MKEKINNWSSKQNWIKIGSTITNISLAYVFLGIVYYILELLGIVKFPTR